ncbi:MAG: hypothetical protein EXS00_03015 [Phycisphaerales bacterium]|nr:hypothetical protein [Phycisphaerales bacterium]
MEVSIHIDYGRPVPLFVTEGVPLLPHGVTSFYMFEPLYRQMIDACLKAARGGSLLQAAPFAVATVAGMGIDAATPRLRAAVCVGKIVRHKSLVGGSHEILVHGVCRARIVSMDEASGERLYRRARLEPVADQHRKPATLASARAGLEQMLKGSQLQKMESARQVALLIAQQGLPPAVALELAGFVLIRDAEVRYQLLEEPDPRRRAKLVWRQVRRLEALIAMAEKQSQSEWPRGVSWN